MILILAAGKGRAQNNPDSGLLRFKNDFAQLAYYREDNQLLAQRKQKPAAVFIGNSITEMWAEQHPAFFTRHNFTNRGISGQTSPQILLRFRQDVVDLHPARVVLLCGINDIAGNTGPATPEQILGNIASMAEIAAAHHIEVYLCSVLPAHHFFWNPDAHPEQAIIALNQLISRYAAAHHFHYVNYYDRMNDGRGGLREELTVDGVHCTGKGYEIMEATVLPFLSNRQASRK